MRIAGPVELSSEQRTVLRAVARQRSLPLRVVERARIVLLAADGLENKQIAQRLHLTQGEGSTVAEAISRRRRHGTAEGRAAAG